MRLPRRPGGQPMASAASRAPPSRNGPKQIWLRRVIRRPARLRRLPEPDRGAPARDLLNPADGKLGGADRVIRPCLYRGGSRCQNVMEMGLPGPRMDARAAACPPVIVARSHGSPLSVRPSSSASCSPSRNYRLCAADGSGRPGSAMGRFADPGQDCRGVRRRRPMGRRRTHSGLACREES